MENRSLTSHLVFSHRVTKPKRRARALASLSHAPIRLFLMTALQTCSFGFLFLELTPAPSTSLHFSVGVRAAGEADFGQFFFFLSKKGDGCYYDVGLGEWVVV